MPQSKPIPKTLSRRQGEVLLFEGLSTPRFTQDTPILPDVWLQFAQHPKQSQPLLITPHESWDHQGLIGELAKVIKNQVEEHRKEEQWSKCIENRVAADVVYNRSTIRANLYLDEVVRILIPLSQWWAAKIQNHSQPGRDLEQWPLWRIASRNQNKRKISKEVIKEALAIGDPRVRDINKHIAIKASQQRADLAFPKSHEKSQISSASGQPEIPPVWNPRNYEARFNDITNLKPDLPEEASRYRVQAAEFAQELDTLWMIRIVGTLATLFFGSADISKYLPETVGESFGTNVSESDLADYYSDVVNAASRMLERIDEHPHLTPSRTVDREQPSVFPLIHSISLCRKATTSIWRSRATVKADAAVQLFDINCKDITWAVVDSGIDATHPVFLSRETGLSRVIATYDFTFLTKLLAGNLEKIPEERRSEVEALIEEEGDIKNRLQNGQPLNWPELIRFIRVPHTAAQYYAPIQEHGTHVAGIIGADAPEGSLTIDGEVGSCRGLCPEIKLIDFRVLGDKSEGDEFNVMAALQLIRYLNANREIPAIHGVNLSFSLPHDVVNYACGRTPICSECERLVNSGVVVVAAAGNDGYLTYTTVKGHRDNYRSISITDPGNSESVITVGATHRLQPHSYGVSYFSSRGPTGDGRSKPDLVAPGERIYSAVPGTNYKSMDGTSMAAPHVSGAAALLLARHRELIGQPKTIKHILCDSATDLGRERYFQGAGMLDVLRALQLV